MFCRNCGSEMRDDAKFCPNCGTLNSSAAAGPDGTSGPVWSSSGGQGWNTPPQSQTQTGGDSPAGDGKQNRRGLGLMIGGGVAAVAVIALLVVTVSGLFTSPKSRVDKAVSKTMSAYSDVKKDLEMPDMKQLWEDKSVSVRASMELKDINSQLVGYDLSDLYGLGVRMSTNYDGSARKMDAQLSAFWDDEDIAALQMLADGAKLYFGSPQFTGDTFIGMNTETLGADLAEMTGDSSVEDISFNIFELMDIIMSTESGEDFEKAIHDANKTLMDQIEAEKDGTEEIEVNGTDIKATLYNVTIPQDALKDYVKTLEDALSAVDYVDMYERLFKAMGIPQDDIDYMMADLEDLDIYGELFDGIRYALDELGDLDLEVYVSQGHISAVIYKETIQGTEVEIGLYLGGGEKGDQYVDNLSLEIEIEGDKLVVASSGNHTGKGGSYTDETTLSLLEGGSKSPMFRLTSDMEYEPKGKGDNFQWTIDVDAPGANGAVKMEGRLTTSKNSLDLKLDDVSVHVMGLKVLSLGVEYYAGPCDGMDIKVKSPMMIADMDEYDAMELISDIEDNAEDWAYDMQNLLGSRLSEALLWQLMYAF